MILSYDGVAPSLGPAEIEQQITFPVEQSLAGLPKIAQMRSISKFGLSQVTLTFADGADLHRARQVVAERLGAVEVPPGVGRSTCRRSEAVADSSASMVDMPISLTKVSRSLALVPCGVHAKP